MVAGHSIPVLNEINPFFSLEPIQCCSHSIHQHLAKFCLFALDLLNGVVESLVLIGGIEPGTFQARTVHRS